MRYYIVNANGEIFAESSSREKIEMKMQLLFDEKEIVENEIEIIEGL